MNTFLGIELGSTRIKAVLIGEDYAPIASGGFDWENRFENGVWTYHLEDVWQGLQASFSSLKADYFATYQKPLPPPAGIGVSAMMHGYLAFNQKGALLAPFRTWRNTTTEEAAAELTGAFAFNIPQRWSVAHIYQAMLNGESHVGDVAFLTTLAGYVHYKLTGQKVLGIGDASGMFPIDSLTKNYDAKKIAAFDALAAKRGVSKWRIAEILPTVRLAGEEAGTLTEEGAKLLDPSGTLQAGIPLCPPEGDAGTGMVATNSIAPRTGNVSAGTSVFAMLVLEEALSRVYTEIDMVTTPAGWPVAMVHCNNCTPDLDAWVGLFGEAMAQMGAPPAKSDLYRTLYQAALSGDPDGGGLVSCNYLSGEHITGFHEGRPLFVRTQDSAFTLPNFMRTLLFSAMASLRIGMDILTGQEGVKLEQIVGHGGLFKTEHVGQKLMAGALGIPVSVMESAGEGGAWGIALLAAYAIQKGQGESLDAFLENRVFSGSAVTSAAPDERDVTGFAAYLARYQAMLAVEGKAIEVIENRGTN